MSRTGLMNHADCDASAFTKANHNDAAWDLDQRFDLRMLTTLQNWHHKSLCTLTALHHCHTPQYRVNQLHGTSRTLQPSHHHLRGFLLGLRFGHTDQKVCATSGWQAANYIGKEVSRCLVPKDGHTFISNKIIRKLGLGPLGIVQEF